MREHVKAMEQKLNEAYPALWMKSDMQKHFRAQLEQGLSQQIQDKRLLKGAVVSISYLRIIIKLTLDRLSAWLLRWMSPDHARSSIYSRHSAG
jgi:hypothetical protein